MGGAAALSAPTPAVVAAFFGCTLVTTVAAVNLLRRGPWGTQTGRSGAPPRGRWWSTNTGKKKSTTIEDDDIDITPSVQRRLVGSALPRERGCIYLDYAATCPVYPDVADAMVPYLYRHWGNPSSGHAYGSPCASAVEEARERVRRLINAERASEIVFCSCGSEADNWAILGALGGAVPPGTSSSSGDPPPRESPLGEPKVNDRHKEPRRRRHVVVSTIEHPAILATVDASDTPSPS